MRDDMSEVCGSGRLWRLDKIKQVFNIVVASQPKLLLSLCSPLATSVLTVANNIIDKLRSAYTATVVSWTIFALSQPTNGFAYVQEGEHASYSGMMHTMDYRTAYSAM